MTTVNDIIELMQIIAPESLAMSHDNVGLHAGDRAATVKKIVVALDASLPVIRHARAWKADMLVVHHPRIYKPLPSLDESEAMPRIASEIVRAGLAVYCAHTNLDIAPGGVNDTLADLAGLTERQPLLITGSDSHLKLVTFVPESHLESVRDAVCAVGAGVIGEYDHCSFTTEGLGTFRGSDASNPYVGKAGQLESVNEFRFETVLPSSAQRAVVDALKAAHPYEEVAFDLYPLRQSTPYGCGRIGTLKKDTTLLALARKMKKACKATGAQYIGDPNKKIKTVAVWSGGGSPVDKVRKSGADILVTGELGYHDRELLQMGGISLVLLGHGPSEEIILEPLAKNLKEGLDHIQIQTYCHAVAQAVNC